MADQKKFLDYEGVKHLWSKVNMQDYPNNETLMAIINAIDETKADKSELENIIANLPQSDWNQNDSTAADYVKNKPKIATDEDIMDLLTEIGVVEPVTMYDGSILTNSIGEIYTL